MVEIKLEALDLSSADKDTYVAVRVGENQKLCRLGAEKNYKFPKSALGEKGERKYGKVDVFQKVGSQTISVRYDADVAAQEIKVPFPSKGEIPFRVTLFDASPVPEPDGKDLNQHFVNAKSYLTEHNLEMKLSDAMQAVLRERPKNPLDFIAAKLTGNEGMYKRVPPEVNTEDLRKKAQGYLLDATATGKLEDALAQVKTPTAAREGGLDTDALRQQAKATLLNATANGSLDASLQKLKEKKGELGATEDSKPVESAAESKPAAGAEEKPADAGAAEASTVDAEALKKQAKENLLKATEAGTMDASIAAQAEKDGEKAAAAETPADYSAAPAAEEKPTVPAAEDKPTETPAAEDKPTETPAAEEKPAETPAA